MTAPSARPAAGGASGGTGKPPRPARPFLIDSLRAALVAGGLVSAVLVVLQAALIWEQGSPFDLLFPAVATVYLVAGADAWWRRPRSRFGALIMQGGLALLVVGLGSSGVPALELVSQLVMTWILAIIVHLLLAFPSGRLRHRATRAIVTAGYLNSLVLQAPQVLLGPQDAVAAASAVTQRVLGLGVMAATAAVLLVRLRRSSRAERRTLVPLYGYGLLVAGLIPLSTNLFRDVLGMSPLAVGVLQMAGVGGVPLAFVVAMARGAFAPTAEAEELAMWLSSGPTRTPLPEALRRALGDPSVAVAYWLPDRREYVDGTGARVRVPEEGPRPRASVPVEVGGQLVGAITHDPTVTDDRAVREAARVVALALDGERLTAQLKAGESQLRRSRARLVQAGDQVRERIARDLHDGLQARLVLLGIEAQRLAHAADATCPDIAGRAIVLRKEIDAAAAELRQISHQIMPSAVVQHGLAGAIEDLTLRMPIETSFEAESVPDGLPPACALTAYFTVAEGLSNAVKHAGARAASVSISREGPVVVVEVSDDGVGGAVNGRGSGLSGLRDRVEAIGGRLRLDSPVGLGTRLRVEVPCAS